MDGALPALLLHRDTSDPKYACASRTLLSKLRRYAVSSELRSLNQLLAMEHTQDLHFFFELRIDQEVGGQARNLVCQC